MFHHVKAFVYTVRVDKPTIGRTLAARLRELPDDPGMTDLLSFLRTLGQE